MHGATPQLVVLQAIRKQTEQSGVGERARQRFLVGRSGAMPKSKELVSSSSSGSDSDSEVEKKLKRKKQAVPEKPVKKQKPGETS